MSEAATLCTGSVPFTVIPEIPSVGSETAPVADVSTFPDDGTAVGAVVGNVEPPPPPLPPHAEIIALASNKTPHPRKPCIRERRI
ncbi:MAG: hypothetical protein WBD74_01765 [Candidatus Aquilonibacter sp.]